jgi:hypothetical protein
MRQGQRWLDRRGGMAGSPMPCCSWARCYAEGQSTTRKDDAACEALAERRRPYGSGDAETVNTALPGFSPSPNAPALRANRPWPCASWMRMMTRDEAAARPTPPIWTPGLRRLPQRAPSIAPSRYSAAAPSPLPRPSTTPPFLPVLRAASGKQFQAGEAGIRGRSMSRRQPALAWPRNLRRPAPC